jgi:hypothetical protein
MPSLRNGTMVLLQSLCVLLLLSKEKISPGSFSTGQLMLSGLKT